jgi:hypothetical protein
VDGIRRRVVRKWLVEESVTTALEGQEPETPSIPHPPADDSDFLTKEEWKALENECRKAGMPWGTATRFIADTLGIPLKELDSRRVTQRQRQLVMERLQTLQPSSQP